MNLEYTFIAIMFPAIPLTMTLFGGRFHTVSVLIRKIHDDYIFNNSMPAEFDKQLEILKSRIFFLEELRFLWVLVFYLIRFLFLLYFLI